MSFKISFGSRWLEILCMKRLGIAGFAYLQVEYGHNSTKNLINIFRHHGAILCRWKKKRTRTLRRAIV